MERCERIAARNATRAELLAHHDEAQINLLESTKYMDAAEQENVAALYDAIYFNKVF